MNNDINNEIEFLTNNTTWRANWSCNLNEGKVTHCTGLIFELLKATQVSDKRYHFEFTCINPPSERDQEYIDKFKRLIPQVFILFSESLHPEQSTSTEINIVCNSLESLSSDEQNMRNFEINHYKDHLIENDYWRSQWTLDLHEAKAKHSNGLVYVLDGSNIVDGDIKFKLHCIQLPQNTPEDYQQNPLFHEQMQNLGMQALILLTENQDLPGVTNSQRLH